MSSTDAFDPVVNARAALKVYRERERYGKGVTASQMMREIAVTSAALQRDARPLGDLAAEHRLPLPPRGMRLLDLVRPFFGPRRRPRSPLVSVPEPSEPGTLAPKCSSETPATGSYHYAGDGAVTYVGPVDARFVKRVFSADPDLLRHCLDVSRRWREEAASVRATMAGMRWPFPLFVPHARPYDWEVDDADA